MFLKASHIVEVNERGSTTLNLTAEAYPETITYAWSRGQTPIKVSEDQRIVGLGPLLMIKNASRSDSGEYACVAENEEGQSRKAVNVNVLCKLKFYLALG